MPFSSANPIVVHANILGGWIQCGDLSLREEEGGRISYATFSYSHNSLHLGLRRFCIDPVSLPAVGNTVKPCAVPPDRGLPLHGAFADLMPGSWGRLCIEKMSGETDLTESDFLLRAQGDRPGALDLAMPQGGTIGGTLAVPVERLPTIVELVDRLAKRRPIPSSRHRDLSACLSLPGDRPKASLRDQNGVLWLAKLPLKTDKWDVPEIEYATLLLAQRCRIVTPPIKLIRLGKRSVLILRRFDRYWGSRTKPFSLSSSKLRINQIPYSQQEECRIHAVSGTTLLGVDGLTSHLFGWADLVEAYREVAFPVGLFKDLEELFRRAVFNIIAGVDQDPFSNTTFLFDSNRGGWRLGPYYGARSDHNRKPGMPRKMGSLEREARLENLMSIHTSFNLKRSKALAIISRILEKLTDWDVFLNENEISQKTIDEMRMAIRSIEDVSKDGFRNELAECKNK
jgi:serine/threonine-protein kinase HipA